MIRCVFDYLLDLFAKHSLDNIRVGLDGDQLQAVLEALDPPLGATGGGPSPSFGELDDSQLERVLRSLEG